MNTFAVFFALLLNFFASAQQSSPVGSGIAQQSPFATKESQLNVIINGDRASQASREMYLILQTLQQAKTDFLENPERFKVIDSFTSGEPPRQMSQDEVVTMYFSQLVADGKISYKITPPDWFEAAKHLAPSIGLDIGLLEPIFDGLTLEGNPPLTWEIGANGMNPGAMLVSLSEQPGQLGVLVRESFEYLFKYDYDENLLMTKQLRDAEELYFQHQNNTLLSNQLGKINQQIKDFKRLQAEWNKQLTAAKDAEAKAEMARAQKIDLEMRRNEVRGGLQMATTVLQILGNPEAARAFNDIYKLTEIAFLLQDGKAANGVPLNSLATANLYVAGAGIVVSMLSGHGKSEMEAIMEQLQALFDLLNATRKEMHERFDLVDMKLDYLIFRIDSGLHALQNGTGRLEENLAMIQNAIDDLRTSNQQFSLALYNRIVFDDISACRPREQGFSPPISLEEFHACFLRLENNLYRYSAFGYDPLSQGDQSIENVAVDLFSFPYVSSLPRLIQKLRNEYFLPVQNESKVLNPYVWNDYIQQLTLIWTSHPQYAVKYGNYEIQKALNTAEDIQKLYGSLALTPGDSERKIVNIPLFEKLNENYQNLLLNTLDWLDVAARNNNELGINPGLIAPLPAEELPQVNSAAVMPICSGVTAFGLNQLSSNGIYPYIWLGTSVPGINTNWDSFGPLKALKDQRPEGLMNWPSAFQSLPPSFLNHEKKYPGSFTICLRQYVIESWTLSNRSSRAKLSIVLDAQIAGITAAQSNITLELEHNLTDSNLLQLIPLEQFEAMMQWPAEIVWPRVKFGLLFKMHWDNNSPESQLPANGILARSFNDIAKWDLKINLEQMQSLAQEHILNDPDYKMRRKELNEIRNTMRILLEIGLSDSAPDKIATQALLREAYDVVPVGIRSLDTLTEQYLKGRFTGKEIVEQSKIAGTALIENLKKMNASDVSLEPRNASIDASIQSLQMLLTF
jgi:hypothetical protein